MKIKRFFATDMRQAIHQVRAEQGPDAVILSTRTTAGGVEIVAAVDYDAELVTGMLGGAAEPAQPVQSAQPEPEEEAYQRPSPERIEWSQDPALSAMQAELKSLRAILQEQVSRLSCSDQDRRFPLRAELVKRLAAIGLDESLARDIAGKTSTMRGAAPAWREALVGLARELPVVAADPLEEGGLIALVGATGVGKTTTAAKLAARACMRFGSGAVAMISTDDFRVGAQRQLGAFGLLLGVPVRQVASAEQLQASLAEFSGRRVVIVDTAGMGQRDLRLLQEMRKLTGVDSLQSYLVLPANVQREVMEEVIDAFGRERLAGCVLSKVDETARLGAVLSAVIAQRLPVAFVSNGQRVPEDLALARCQDLVASAVSLAARHARRQAATPAPAPAPRPNTLHTEVSHVHA
ncbi:flagellar biosynthesis protein FlhF [Thioalkalivibrio sp. XN279]|uniref:flagellar biosynthesis protein FlhF n=1 Tax=Thioalkalivibrio sp. XN279 TaxID=2714953 RepID=UPI001407BB05|nr:flagellar biosynthesis protein FlhF [Thioalkalivibrio sp. XN279]